MDPMSNKSNRTLLIGCSRVDRRMCVCSAQKGEIVKGNWRSEWRPRCRLIITEVTSGERRWRRRLAAIRWALSQTCSISVAAVSTGVLIQLAIRGAINHQRSLKTSMVTEDWRRLPTGRDGVGGEISTATAIQSPPPPPPHSAHHRRHCWWLSTFRLAFYSALLRPSAYLKHCSTRPTISDIHASIVCLPRSPFFSIFSQ